MAKRKTAHKVKPGALGDDPLAWITKDATAVQNQVKETQPKKAKTNKKATKKIQAVKKVKVKKTQAKKNVKKRSPKANTGKAKILQQTHIKLDPVLIISDAQTLYGQLDALLDTKQNITIDKWVSPERAMEFLNIKRKTTLQKLRDTGELTFTQPQKKIILYDYDSILLYLNRNSKKSF